MIVRLSLMLAVSATATFAEPASPDQAQEVFQSLGLDQMIDIMREEGLSYGTEIGADLFGGSAPGDWATLVDDIYNPDRMEAQVLSVLTAELDKTDAPGITDFFQTEPGQTIISLEIAARRALLDDTVKDAATEVAALAVADNTERFQLVERFVEANDLIETNVVGAMNSNYAFFTALSEGGALSTQLTQDQILEDVWRQEPEIRQNTTEWVYSFLLLAYQPLSDADLETYIAFSDSDVGRNLNDALFVAFDGVFESVSRALGLGAAQYMRSDDI